MENTEKRVFILDGKFMYNKNAAHKYLAKKMKFPDYYGENLDALYDLLTEMDIPTRIQLINAELVIKNLKEYGQSMLEVFRQGASMNKNLDLMIFDLNTPKRQSYKLANSKDKTKDNAAPDSTEHTDVLMGEEAFDGYLNSQEL